MKVAVISPCNTPCGKSSLVYLLAGIYSRSQGKKASIYKTSYTEDHEMVTLSSLQVGTKSPTVFKALLNTGQITSEELHDYALRVGSEEVSLFDFYASKIDDDIRVEMTDKAINIDNNPLKIFEVNDIGSELTKIYLDQADFIFVMTDASRTSLKKTKAYLNDMERANRFKVINVVGKYNPNEVSEKMLANLLGVKQRELVVFPYNTLVAKEAMTGTLDSIVKYIVKGHYELVNLRPKMLEMLQVSFDTPTKKVIKPMKEWV